MHAGIAVPAAHVLLRPGLQHLHPIDAVALQRERRTQASLTAANDDHIEHALARGRDPVVVVAQQLHLVVRPLLQRFQRGGSLRSGAGLRAVKLWDSTAIPVHGGGHIRHG